jgi:hypothetical protein
MAMFLQYIHCTAGGAVAGYTASFTSSVYSSHFGGFFYSRASAKHGASTHNHDSGRPSSSLSTTRSPPGKRMQTCSYTCEGQDHMISDRLHVLIFEKLPVAYLWHRDA